MRYLFFLFFLFYGFISSGQIGFNKSYDQSNLSLFYGGIETSNDTLIVYGLFIDSVEGKAGMCLTFMDTLGNVLHEKKHKDSLGDEFTIFYMQTFIKLSNGTGYVGIGQLFKRDGYFAKFDNVGNLILFQEYSDSTTTLGYQTLQQIIELKDGFLIAGSDASSTLDIFVMKVDFNGKIKWKKRYGRPDRFNLFGSFLILNDNEFVIGGGTTHDPTSVPLNQIRNTSRIYAIDSLGNLKWEWESELSLEEPGVAQLSKTPEGNWVYRSGRGWYNATYNEISIQPTFNIRDKDFNLIKRDTFGVADFPINGFQNAIRLRNGDWFAVGVKPVIYPTNPPVPEYNALTGWMLRLDKDINQVWSRVDTSFWSKEDGSENYLWDAVELPSGSIVACGYNRTDIPVAKLWGWVIKVGSDGCVDTLGCHSVDAVEIENLNNTTKIYPNPTPSIINIKNEKIGSWDRIEIVNSIGQTAKILNHLDQNQIDFSGFEDGIYFLRLVKSGASITKKVVKKQ